jgi:hypothetical protein
MSDYECAYGAETGRLFVYDDADCGFIIGLPDNDEWHLWTEYRAEDGTLTYVSDHEGYALDAEEFGDIPADVAKYAEEVRTLIGLLPSTPVWDGRVEWFDVEDGKQPALRVTDEPDIVNDEWALPWFHVVYSDGSGAWVAVGMTDGDQITGAFMVTDANFPVKVKPSDGEPPYGRVYAVGRDEGEACEAGTVGCSINHSEDDGGCETW